VCTVRGHQPLLSFRFCFSVRSLARCTARLIWASWAASVYTQTTHKREPPASRHGGPIAHHGAPSPTGTLGRRGFVLARPCSFKTTAPPRTRWPGTEVNLNSSSTPRTYRCLQSGAAKPPPTAPDSTSPSCPSRTLCWAAVRIRRLRVQGTGPGLQKGRVAMENWRHGVASCYRHCRQKTQTQA